MSKHYYRCPQSTSRSLTHSIAQLLTHPPTNSLAYPLTHLFTHLCLCLLPQIHAQTHAHTRTDKHTDKISSRVSELTISLSTPQLTRHSSTQSGGETSTLTHCPPLPCLHTSHHCHPYASKTIAFLDTDNSQRQLVSHVTSCLLRIHSCLPSPLRSHSSVG